MRRHAQVLDAFEIGVLAGIQPVLEELLDLTGTKLRRRQADVVDNQQGDDFAFGAGIAIGRRTMADAGEPASSAVQLHRKS
ncbi:hypothetical protein D3C79_722310 [compost metagenome]